jgi:hypothetical protein
VSLNPPRLARFSDWAGRCRRAHCRAPLPPVPGEYFLDYITRLAEADHLEFAELTGALDDPAATLHHPDRWRQSRT